MPGWIPYAVAGGSSILGALSGKSQADAQREANRERGMYSRMAVNYLDPAGGDFRTQFGALQGYAAPAINAMLQGNQLAGQNAAYGAQAGLARAGLGNTGLGASLGGGLLAGAAFQGNQLRSRLLMEMLGMTGNIQAQRAGFLAGTPVQPVMGGWMQGALAGGSGALTALDAVGAFK